MKKSKLTKSIHAAVNGIAHSIFQERNIIIQKLIDRLLQGFGFDKDYLIMLEEPFWLV